MKRARVNVSRIIDLRNNIDDINVPWPDAPLCLTLCAGDGIQRGITDIEYFTTKLEGFGRETKPTNIFCCSPTYNPSGLSDNIEYMKANPELKILLVLCDTKDLVHISRFETLFENKLSMIHEDMACYGATLSADVLHNVLVPGGYYMLDDVRRYSAYDKTDSRFTYETNKIIRNVSGGRKSNRRKRRKRRKTVKN